MTAIDTRHHPDRRLIGAGRPTPTVSWPWPAPGSVARGDAGRAFALNAVGWQFALLGDHRRAIAGYRRALDLCAITRTRPARRRADTRPAQRHRPSQPAPSQLM